jgi:hypothetical protein
MLHHRIGTAPEQINLLVLHNLLDISAALDLRKCTRVIF